MKSEYLRRKELDHVLAALTESNALAIEVALHTGLRIGDVLALKPPVKRQFWITESKTRKRRRVNLSQTLVDKLNRHAGKHWVFPGRLDDRKHRTRQAVWADVKRAATAFRLPMNVTPHSARKYYAVQELSRGRGDIKRVRRALNHSDDATTMIYTMAEALYNAKYYQDDSGRIKRR